MSKIIKYKNVDGYWDKEQQKPVQHFLKLIEGENNLFQTVLNGTVMLEGDYETCNTEYNFISNDNKST